MTPDPATWKLLTPGAPGPVAIIEIAGDVDRALEALAMRPVPVGDVRRRSIAGVDVGVVARWSPTCAHLMPHGGRAVVRAILDALARAGLHEASRAAWPEAADEHEARMLDALARGVSPIGMDLLLDQPRRWRERALEPDDALDAALAPLLDPPLVVALGASNIGKSTLANELAGRRVAIVADEPGTTRDHVGVEIEAGGLLVRYLDTPGIRPSPDPLEREAADLAQDIVARADLLLLCADPAHPPPHPPTDALALIVALRTDLGTPAFDCDVDVSVHRGRGVDDLARAIRDALLPRDALDDPRPWRFWRGRD